MTAFSRKRKEIRLSEAIWLLARTLGSTQEASAYSGHLGCTCYDLFSEEGIKLNLPVR